MDTIPNMSRLGVPIVRLIFSLFLSGILLASGSAWGTVVVKVDHETLAANADLIFRGTVLDLRSFADSRDERRISTEVIFDVEEVFKGSLQRGLFRVTLPGGKRGDWELKVVGMPGFTKGEDVLLFMERSGGDYTVSGLSLGKFRIVKEEGGSVRAVRSFADVEHAEIKNGSMTIQAPVSANETVDFDRLVSTIRSTLRKGSGD